ncbi:uncharacterized protein CCOS01_10067 [Colletotrichum costaricense]|uniref:Uncharacterized protein n=1 Tax=Colletotrichum costaricense TaxID=1209916 RepID=A0AAJ0DZ64_9PEZI|nr:uncharacterized protein CCOS01_10067 [Colletotrichum costaricense]KAK1522355.1 hypothetical protein CCOS01_10067 [Colletotrichum costaricense]
MLMHSLSLHVARLLISSHVSRPSQSHLTTTRIPNPLH